MGRITTHVLDTAAGKPAAGMRVVFRSLDGESEPLEAFTNADGRLDKPLLEGSAFRPGRYELAFHVGDYFRAQGEERGMGQGMDLSEPAFLDIVPIRFGVASDTHYHVPLLVSPYGYSTYRGS